MAGPAKGTVMAGPAKGTVMAGLAKGTVMAGPRLKGPSWDCACVWLCWLF